MRPKHSGYAEQGEDGGGGDLHAGQGDQPKAQPVELGSAAVA